MLDTRRVWSGIVKIIKSDKSLRGVGGGVGGEWERRGEHWLWEPSVSEKGKRQLLERHRRSGWDGFNGMRGQKSKRKLKNWGANESWRASDGARVVFSLASSSPDGKGSSSSSPRCIWQQLLFTPGYCTSLSVSSPVSRWKATLARAVKDYPTFSHSTKSSDLTPWPPSHIFLASRCTVRHTALIFPSVLCVPM